LRSGEFVRSQGKARERKSERFDFTR
jgi:hypothetical protein